MTETRIGRKTFPSSSSLLVAMCKADEMKSLVKAKRGTEFPWVEKKAHKLGRGEGRETGDKFW